jgi:hypothetical protein
VNPDMWEQHGLDTAPRTSLTNGMHWMPRDEDSDVEVPPWSWLVACPRTETPQ